jgi:predicted nucleotidyltransferase
MGERVTQVDEWRRYRSEAKQFSAGNRSAEGVTLYLPLAWLHQLEKLLRPEERLNHVLERALWAELAVRETSEKKP